MKLLFIFIAILIGLIGGVVLGILVDHLFKFVLPKTHLPKQKEMIIGTTVALIFIVAIMLLIQWAYKPTTTVLLPSSNEPIISTDLPVNLPDGKIVFVSWRTKKPYIYITNPDDSGQALLLGQFIAEYSPRWSQDNQWVILSVNTKIIPCNNINCAIWDILKVNIANQQSINLTDGYSMDNESPDLSADGSQIAFIASLDDTTGDLVIMNADGTGKVATGIASANCPNWLNDGKTLIYTTPHSSAHSIQLYDTALAKSTELFIGNISSCPRISPNGKVVVFSMVNNGYSQIYTINVVGTNLIQLTNGNYNNISPTWSPDGNWLTFTTNRDGNYEIYIMSLESFATLRLTHNVTEDTNPDWSH